MERHFTLTEAQELMIQAGAHLIFEVLKVPTVREYAETAILLDKGQCDANLPQLHEFVASWLGVNGKRPLVQR